MKIDLSGRIYSPYIGMADVLKQWTLDHHVHCDLIITIRTSVLGEITTIARRNEYGYYDFLDDWYEGGEIELLGITPIDEIYEPKYKL